MQGIQPAACALPECASLPQSLDFVLGVLSCAEVQAPLADALAGSPCLDQSRFAGDGSAWGARLTMRGVLVKQYGTLCFMTDAAGGLRSGVAACNVPFGMTVGHQYLLACRVQEHYGMTELANHAALIDEGVVAVPAAQPQTADVLDRTAGPSRRPGREPPAAPFVALLPTRRRAGAPATAPDARGVPIGNRPPLRYPDDLALWSRGLFIAGASPWPERHSREAPAARLVRRVSSAHKGFEMSEIVQVALRGSRRDFFLNSRHLWLQLNDRVVVQTEHGEAIGGVVLKDQALLELKRPGSVTREIIRKATEEDLDLEDHLAQREAEAFEYCRERIGVRELKMDLSEVEASFTGHRITFYFLAEHRVDFRELVKDLAARFQTRIELRQIGVRDQAKRLDGCGPCGRAFCCSTWLRDFHPVTLRMAREQQLTLNPTKISGTCGRLMCCLAYELNLYREGAAKLPPLGAQLRTGKGLCTVFRAELHQQVVWVRDSEGQEHRITRDMLPPGPWPRGGVPGPAEPNSDAVDNDEPPGGIPGT